MKNNSSLTKTFKALAIGGLCSVLSGCGPKPTIKMEKELIEDSSNYSVTRVAVFRDELAYENKRGIYEIVDHKTGKVYLGVSGIGICEKGSHLAGKVMVSDER